LKLRDVFLLHIDAAHFPKIRAEDGREGAVSATDVEHPFTGESTETAEQTHDQTDRPLHSRATVGADIQRLSVLLHRNQFAEIETGVRQPVRVSIRSSLCWSRSIKGQQSISARG
jgi:Tfp pilus assembly protein PilV